jgi:hypothetical protein
MRAKLVWFTSVFIILLFIDQFLMNVGTRPSFVVDAIENSGENSLRILYSLSSGSYSTDLHVLAIPTNMTTTSPTKDLPIYIYFENSYQTYKSWTPYDAIAIGLLSELQMEVKRRNYEGSVSLINSEQMKKIMTEQENAVLVIPTVAYWTTLLPPPIDKDLMESWVRSGGILFWVGAHPELRSMFDFPFEKKTIPWDDLSLWRCNDLPHSGHTSLTMNAQMPEDRSIEIRHDNLSLAGRGFWGTLNFAEPLDLSSEDWSISLLAAVSNASHLSLVYVQIEDENRNFRQYYLFPHRATTINEWTSFLIRLEEPNYQSQSPLNLRNITSLSIVAQTKEEDNMIGVTANVSIKDVSLLRMTELIPSLQPLTEATEESEISNALSLRYQYVDLGPSIESISLLGGKVLGKISRGLGDQGNRTSTGMISIGEGKLVFFGYGIFPPFTQYIVAWDIMQILQSGILYATGEIQYKTYSLGKYSAEEDSLDVSVKDGTSVVVFVFSPDLHNSFYQKIVIDPNRGN